MKKLNEIISAIAYVLAICSLLYNQFNDVELSGETLWPVLVFITVALAPKYFQNEK